MTAIHPTRECPIFTYNCFSTELFGGNIGGLVFDAGELDVDAMRNVAREINAPVTGFVTKIDGRDVSARFFMPSAEIAMCGHVTVGLFTHLAESDPAAEQAYTLHVAAGDIPIQTSRDGDGRITVMMGLSLPKPISPDLSVSDLADALGIEVAALAQMPTIGGMDAGLRHAFLQVPSTDMLREMKPDFARLKALSEAAGLHTIACFAMQDPVTGFTAMVRDFCPAVGVDEAPASGTTNGALFGYLVANGLVPAKAQRIVNQQGLDIGRPSQIVLDIDVTDNSVTKLMLGGSAIRCMSGRIAAG